MKLDLQLAKSQASQATRYASDLSNIQRDIGMYKNELQNYWKADEMVPINAAIDQIMNKTSSSSRDIASLDKDIRNAAEALYELDCAKEALDVAKRELNGAQGLYNFHADHVSDTLFKSAKKKYDAALNRYNIADARVKSMM